MKLALLLACAVFAADMTQPPSFSTTASRLIEEMEPIKRLAIVDELARRPVQTPGDVAMAVELFHRFGDDNVRAAILSAVELTDPSNRALEQTFTDLIRLGEPEGMFIGLRGAGRLRSRDALPYVRKLAKKKFKTKRVEDLPLAGERDRWWVQYEALNALARIDGERAYKLILKQAKAAPAVARILAMSYWEKALPLAVQWSASPDEKERADEALKAPVPTPALRATRVKMLELLRDPKSDPELRHQLALKIGFTSTETEVQELIAERQKTPDESTKLMLAAAVFASRSRSAVPLLVEYMKENPDPRLREGAREQLRDSLPAGDYRPLLEWAAAKDPDPAIRASASAELKTAPR